MSDFTHDFEKVRRFLMRHYHSKIMAHGSYIITLIVGFIGLFSRIDVLLSTFHLRLLFYFAISLIIFLGAYVIGKTLFWTAILSEVFFAKQDEMNKWQEENYNNIKNVSNIAKFQLFLIHKIQSRAKEKKWYHLYWWTAKFTEINKQSASLCFAVFLISFFCNLFNNRVHPWLRLLISYDLSHN